MAASPIGTKMIGQPTVPVAISAIAAMKNSGISPASTRWAGDQFAGVFDAARTGVAEGGGTGAATVCHPSSNFGCGSGRSAKISASSPRVLADVILADRSPYSSTSIRPTDMCSPSAVSADSRF